MKFSIITVTLNCEHVVEKSIQSVLLQGYADLEYILVDGGSTDGTCDIIRKYANLYPHVRWISERDTGISDAFNKGISMANGDVIGILNADDRYTPKALQVVAAAVAAHPESDVFHGNMLRYQGDTPLFLLMPSDVERNIWHEMPLNHPATFVRRSAYQSAGLFDVTLKIVMDYDLMLRLYKTGSRFCYIDEVLAEMNYGGVSDTQVLAGLQEVYDVSVRHGYPRWKACYWMQRNRLLRMVKNLIRKLGLHSLLHLHPKFRALPPEKDRTL